MQMMASFFLIFVVLLFIPQYVKNDQEDPWVMEICEQVARRLRVVDRLDQSNNPILILNSQYQNTSSYFNYIDTIRCVRPNSVRMIGGINVKCVQRYLKNLFIVANNSGHQIYRRNLHIASGCQAMIER